jgi:phage nucleotide-binding protein
MASKAKLHKISNKIERGLSFCIYGDPGVGKTTLATTLPPDETLIVAAEANLGPVYGKGHNVFLLKDNLEDLEAIYQNIRNDWKDTFKYIVIDNVSELEQWMIRVLTESRKKDFVELKEYGDSAYKMREYLKLFRDLIYNDQTIIFNAWEMPMDIQVKGGEVVTKTFPKLGKKLAIELCGMVDVVGHLEMYEKTGDRYLRFEPTHQIEAKCTFRGLEKFEPITEIPGSHPPQYEGFMPILKKLYEYDYGGNNEHKKVRDKGSKAGGKEEGSNDSSDK